MKRISIFLFALLFGAQINCALAEPWASPGDTRLRNDLQLLDDAGAINIPLSAWPVAWGDLSNALGEVEVATLAPSARAAFERLNPRARDELDSGWLGYRAELGVASNPRIV